MENLIKKTKEFGFLPIIFYASLLSSGVFHEFVSCILSVVLFAGLCFKTVKQKSFKINVDLSFITVSVIVLFYGLSTFWAIDSGMAFLGFLKYLPVLLFILCEMQGGGDKEKILNILPVFAGVTTLVAAILMQIPVVGEYFSVNYRLSGFLQYPNTFALLLLISELLLISKEKLKLFDYFNLAVLVFGIVYTGSRTAFVLAVLSNIAAAFIIKNKLIKYGMLTGLTLVVAVLALLTAFNVGGIATRVLNISFKASSFLGRILYTYDVLPVILKNPFGIGYKGYYYIQQSIQSGVYSVSTVHNDFVQLMVDIGWIPGIALIVTVLKSVFGKRTNGITKIIVCTVFLHSCFDFNLQFIAVFILLLLFLDRTPFKKFETVNKRNALNVGLGVLAVISFYMALPLTLSNFGAYKTSSELYPYNTFNDSLLLTQIEDTETAKIYADKILERNPYVTVAYSARANYYYSIGDFNSLIRVKNEIIEKFPFQHREYWDYASKLIKGMRAYEQAGDFESAEFCEQELFVLKDKLENVKEKVSKLGFMIKDKPVTQFPKDITEIIKSLENEDV